MFLFDWLRCEFAYQNCMNRMCPLKFVKSELVRTLALDDDMYPFSQQCSNYFSYIRLDNVGFDNVGSGDNENLLAPVAIYYYSNRLALSARTNHHLFDHLKMKLNQFFVIFSRFSWIDLTERLHTIMSHCHIVQFHMRRRNVCFLVV